MMASSSGKLSMSFRRLVLVFFALVVTTAMAQTPGGGGGTASNCTNTMTSLAPCLAYVTGNSTTPSASCCSQLGTVFQATPQCLCTLVNGGGPLFLTINQTLALALPGACKVQTPPVSQCKAADAPGSSPATPPGTAPEPAESSNDTPEPAVTPTAESDVPASSSGDGNRSKTVPSTTGGTSDATTTTTRTSLQSLLVGLVIAAIARF